MAIHLSELDPPSQDDRRYIAEVLSNLLADPKISTDEFGSWPDERVLELCNGYLNLDASRALRKDQGIVEAHSLAESRRTLHDSVQTDLERIQESSRQIMDSIAKSAWKFGVLDSSLIKLPSWNYLGGLAGLSNSLAPTLDSFAPKTPLAFGLSARTAMNQLVDAQTNFGLSLQKAFADQIGFKPVTSDFLQSFSSYDFSSILSGWATALPQGLLDGFVQVRRDRRAALLLDANLEFLNDLTEEAIEEAIKNATYMSGGQQRAYIGRRLQSLTSSEDFLKQLEEEVQASPASRRRLKILRSAHEAHRQRQFNLSVPVLYAQVEGLLASVLKEMGLIRWDRQTRKWYESEPETGKYRLVPEWKNGKQTGKMKRVPISGLTGLTQRGSPMTASTLNDTVTHLRDDVSSIRNQVMHGTKTDYGTSRNSSRLLLLALILARQVRQVEE